MLTPLMVKHPFRDPELPAHLRDRYAQFCLLQSKGELFLYTTILLPFVHSIF